MRGWKWLDRVRAVAEVYARVNASATVAISEPSSPDCSGCDTASVDRASAVFQGASQDGSKAFFLAPVSRCWVATPPEISISMTSLPPRVSGSCGVSAGDPAGADVKGVVRISEDGLAGLLRRGWCVDERSQRSGQRAPWRAKIIIL